MSAYDPVNLSSPRNRDKHVKPVHGEKHIKPVHGRLQSTWRKPVIYMITLAFVLVALFQFVSLHSALNSNAQAQDADRQGVVIDIVSKGDGVTYPKQGDTLAVHCNTNK
jgi:hypothetical protein